MSYDVPRLDLADPAFDTTGPDVHSAREQTWWARTPYGFAVLRHAESAALLRDRRFIQGNARWPEQNGIHSGLFHDWWAETLLSLEGGDHDRVRRLLLPAFRKRSIEAMRPSFTALAEELIDGFAARGQVELVAEFAEPYAARIICRLLGLDEEHWPQVAHWADDLGASFSIDVGAQVPRIEAALDGLSGYLADVVAERRAHPREDFVTTLVQAADDPPAGTAGLTDHELSVALVFLVFAGMETTRNQIGLAVQTLLGHPDQWRLLASRPDLGPACVEEVMRVNPTVTWVTREAVEDVDLGDGLVVPAGGVVQVLSHAAGTDPTAMADPGFDLEAAERGEHPPHTGFGAGIHHCLGHMVARVDMAAALPLLARRMPDARADGPGEWMPVSGNTGALRFPLRFTPS
ncbi:Biotin biosynthesis cytochrome P450 [Nocardioides dokdonensis FR1436]|uniref:Biotin biosynthesis cytochrome P450 n=1 Tax=Nocardioides dokdonensis FR1436 TaxID=1300347 RepID=A0A1A9GG21_9ACTN|nr:cytochrome P450 [Nocardioides dokdonensis]ANH37237.1 Biotin biosynthesis cytochrome P450 [Nocardioides dokdonensis FR1436]